MVNNKNCNSHETIDRVTIFADMAEVASGIPRLLSKKGIEVRLQRLKVGDYILSSKCAVERKTTADFIQSICNKRLFAQLGALRANFSIPILLIENSIVKSKIHPNAYRGALLQICLTSRIPIVQTKSMNDSVEMLLAIIKFIQSKPGRQFSFYQKRRPITSGNAQQYILEAIPGIGPQLAKQLLNKFGNLKAVFNSTVEDLQQIAGIGRHRAEKIIELLQKDYST